MPKYRIVHKRGTYRIQFRWLCFWFRAETDIHGDPIGHHELNTAKDVVRLMQKKDRQESESKGVVWQSDD